MYLFHISILRDHTIPSITGTGCLEPNIKFDNNFNVEPSTVPTEVAPASPFTADTVEDCQFVCINVKACNFFSWDENQNKCWIKKLDSGRVVANGVMSGRKRCPKGTI